ncbi:MAG: tripartite tricarboxylate transporter permease [Roseibium sp.]|uniref:tripartite tricarboxylate transporter permease n=1 Tax=Roseibium sp. TaxID=1936156 RepID=UPI002614D99C|nr:tripartite tricarboxylate transporter permease [Roseibium sp.]MCV0424175.1 tripartite tricarboxylate transporter permease [Roseibium sp.]
MDIFSNLALGFGEVLSLQTLFYCFVGVTVGMLIGVLPGIGAMAAISMLLPITFYLEPSQALIMLAGIYYGAQYGNSIASILLNTPGTPSGAITCLDGYPLAQQGRAGAALFMTTFSSFAGSCFAIVCLAAFTPVIADFALGFGSAEYFALMVFGLVLASTVAPGSQIKGLVMVVIGLVLGLVGTDITSGTFRFTFGLLNLGDGLNLVAVAMGVFGAAEVINNLSRSSSDRGAARAVALRELIPLKSDLKQMIKPMLRAAPIGTFLGVLPGAGATIASFVAYGVETRVAKDRSRFGKGAIEGITAPETANNAAAQGGFIPTLALGIPGDAVMALMLGALLIHGVNPGPQLIGEHPEIFWGLLASFWVGNLMLLVMNIPLIGIWVKILAIPYKYLFPGILMLICVGVYSVNNNPFDLLVVFVFSVIGYLMVLARLSPAPMMLGIVLGPMMEENFRRAMLLSRGDATVFLEKPVCAALLGLTLLVLVWPLIPMLMRRMRRPKRRLRAKTLK